MQTYWVDNPCSPCSPQNRGPELRIRCHNKIVPYLNLQIMKSRNQSFNWGCDSVDPYQIGYCRKVYQVRRTPIRVWPGLCTQIPWTERQNYRCVHGFSGPNARTDSVDRTPDVSLRSRIPWTECQNCRCVHGFRGPNARSIVAFTNSVDRTPEVSLRSRILWTGSCHCVHGFTGLYAMQWIDLFHGCRLHCVA
jgi:hypothetical protein